MEGSKIKGLEKGCDSYDAPRPLAHTTMRLPVRPLGTWPSALCSLRPCRWAPSPCAWLLLWPPGGGAGARVSLWSLPAGDREPPFSKPHLVEATHTHTHTQRRGEFDLVSLASGPERKIVWVNSQASRLNAGLRPPPLHPSPPPLSPPTPPATRTPLRSRAPSELRASGREPRAPGVQRAAAPQGMPSSLCPWGRKHTAGRWDPPGPR